MKKRILGAFLLLSSVIGLSSCSLGFVVPTTTTMDLFHVHSYKETVIEPTCEEEGYTLFKCDCSEEYRGKRTEALGHLIEIDDVPVQSFTGSPITPKPDVKFNNELFFNFSFSFIYCSFLYLKNLRGYTIE